MKFSLPWQLQLASFLPSEVVKEENLSLFRVHRSNWEISTYLTFDYWLLCRSPQALASDGDNGEGEQEEEEEKPRKKHVSLHDKHVIGYEDRIRAYSTPDKIFRYFGTLQITEKDGSVQIYMTPEDFLRSITPGWIQPAGLGLDQFLPKMTAEQWERHPSYKKLDPKSVFASLGNHGLISFSDYLFLLTLLASKSNYQLSSSSKQYFIIPVGCS